MSGPGDLWSVTWSPAGGKSSVVNTRSWYWDHSSFYYLDTATECTPSEFIGSTKLRRVAPTSRGCVPIHGDLDRLENWAKRNEIKCNKEKCRILHQRRNNPRGGWPAGRQLCREEASHTGGQQVDCGWASWMRCSLLSTGEDASGVLSSGLPSTRERQTYWREYSAGPQRWLRVWNV